MKILITGANGMLGQHLSVSLAGLGHDVIATGRGPARIDFSVYTGINYIEMDFTNDAMVQQVFASQRPEFVVHAGAMTQIDDCEKNQDLCFETNVQGTAQVLIAAEEYSKYFLFISTDFVFDGIDGNYAENDQLNPLSWYGFSKVQAESTVETAEIPWAIVRTCLVYGDPVHGTRSNILTWVRDNLSQQKRIDVVSDQLRTPTFVDDLVKGIIRILEIRATGIFHLAGKDMLSPYDIALTTAAHLNLDASLITKVDASSFSQPAKRPPKTGLDISKARAETGFEPESFLINLHKIWPPAN